MPELPEVESVVRSLRPLLVGRTIRELIVPAERRIGDWPATLRRLLTAPPQKLREKVSGTRIADLSRVGKNIRISLTADGECTRTLWVHLGMTGRLTSQDSDATQSRHTHLIFELESDGRDASRPRWLHFADIRRFGRVRLTEADDQLHGASAELGPEPLEITEEEFAQRLRRRQARVKAVLLDQAFVRGLGNIYADESLFRAKIHPAKIAARLKQSEAAALHKASQEILREAIAAGGSSISDYVDGQGRAGWFQMHHNVYQRTGEPCNLCETPIRRTIVAGRGSHFCPRCQPGRASAPKRKVAARPAIMKSTKAARAKRAKGVPRGERR